MIQPSSYAWFMTWPSSIGPVPCPNFPISSPAISWPSGCDKDFWSISFTAARPDGTMGIHGDPWGSMGIQWSGKNPGWRLGGFTDGTGVNQRTNGGVSYFQTFPRLSRRGMWTYWWPKHKLGWKQQRNWVSGSLEMINSAVLIWVCLKSSGLSSLSLLNHLLWSIITIYLISRDPSANPSDARTPWAVDPWIIKAQKIRPRCDT